MTWTLPQIPPLSFELAPTLSDQIDQKTKPLGSLGRLETLAQQIGLIQGTLRPSLHSPVVLVFAGDHGLASEGVSPYPQEVTVQMVQNYLRGGAAICVFARQHGLDLQVVDAGVAGDLPTHPQLHRLKIRAGTRNALLQRAMCSEEVFRALSSGAQLINDLKAKGTNVVLLGEMGIGNSSSAALLMSALLPLPIDACVGRGAGHDDAGLQRKIEILTRVQARHADVCAPLEALEAFGGYELAMMVGAMLAAAENRMLIVNDGFITTAALLVAARLCPQVLAYTISSHVSAESPHARLLVGLGLKPLLDLRLRLGEGTGAALAWPLIVSSVNFLNEMATFASAGVSTAV